MRFSRRVLAALSADPFGLLRNRRCESLPTVWEAAYPRRSGASKKRIIDGNRKKSSTNPSGHCPSQQAAVNALVGLLAPEHGAGSAFSPHLGGNGLFRSNRPDFLGYSGGAAPDLHRVPCSSAFPNGKADHQRTSQQSMNLAKLCPVVKQIKKPFFATL